MQCVQNGIERFNFYLSVDCGSFSNSKEYHCFNNDVVTESACVFFGKKQ